MEEEHLSPYDATVKAMGQITSAIVGITLVLMAVFVPMAFFPGSTVAIYRQFSVTLIISIGFSVLMAISLTTALFATFLKTHLMEDQRTHGWYMDRVGSLFGQFYRRF